MQRDLETLIFRIEELECENLKIKSDAQRDKVKVISEVE